MLMLSKNYRKCITLSANYTFFNLASLHPSTKGEWHQCGLMKYSPTYQGCAYWTLFLISTRGRPVRPVDIAARRIYDHGI